MQCLLPLSLVFLPAVYAVVTLEIDSTADVLVPTNVTWTREDGDPTLFDLRFVSGEADLGLAATISAPDGELGGIIPVSFPTQGNFVLEAIDFENDDQVIAITTSIAVSSETASSVGPLPTISAPLSTASSSISSPAATTLTTIITSTSTLTAQPTDPASTLSSTTGTSAIAGSTSSPSSATSKSSPNIVAIVAGVLGGVVLILILAIVYVLLKRRKENAKIPRRMTFHRDLMVQHRPMALDVEHGRVVGSPVLPPLGFQQPVTVQTPHGPIHPHFPASALNTPVPEHPPTHRQVQLGIRIVQVEQQMAGIRRQNRQGSMGPVLEHMKKQVEWLRAERDSPWAKCETDIAPPLLDYYME